MDIVTLFPTAVLRDTLGRSFTEVEINSLLELQNNVRSNEGNYASVNCEVLELPAMVDLKQFCLDKLTQYLTEVLKVPESVKPYITLSWVNYTNQGQHHHRHSHGNSILSGVLYINAQRENDKIEFYNIKHKTIEFDFDEWNVFNSTSWWIPVHTGDIVVFQSELTHGVPKTDGDYTRISLAFNAFVSGEIGYRDQLKWVKLK